MYLGLQMRNIKYKNIFSKFSRHSTIHGICHAAIAQSPKWKRAWYAIFLICFAILAIQVFYLIVKYFQNPRIVDLDVKIIQTFINKLF